MRPCTPSARSRWRTKVVLPAPSGPCSSMKALRRAGVLRQRGRRRRRRPRRARGWRVSRIGACGFASLRAGSRSCSGCGGGRVSWDSPRSGSPASTCPAPSRACWPGWTPASTAHGLHGRARPEARAAGRAGARHAERDHRAHGLPAARHAADWVAREWQGAARPAARRGVGVRPRPRLPQGAAPAPAAPGRPAGGRGGAAGPPRVHRLGAGAGSGTGHAQRPGLARQAHAGPGTRRGLDVLPGRDLRRPGAAAGPTRQRALRQLQRLHRRLPHAGHRRALPAGRAALHQLPDHRTRRADPPSCARCSATASTAATTASSPAPGTSTRSAARCPTSTNAQGLARPRCCAVGLGRGRVPAPHRGQRHPPHRLAALAAQPGGGAGQCLARHGAMRPWRRRWRRAPRPRPGARAHRLGAGAARRAGSRPAPAAASGSATMPSSVDTVTSPAT
jgi:hypothetical protein